MRALFTVVLMFVLDSVRGVCDCCEESLRSRWEARAKENPTKDIVCEVCGGTLFVGTTCRRCGVAMNQ